jgi:hypothetical protein
MVSETFKKIIFILIKFDRPLTISEIHSLLKRHGFRISKPKIRNSINYNKSEYLNSVPINFLSTERVAYFLNREGKKLADRLFIRKR